MELRQGTEQTVRVGVLLKKRMEFAEPLDPLHDVHLGWLSWKYLIKPDGTVIDLVNHGWDDIPNCVGCYYLTLSNIDTDQLGYLTLYIFDNYLLETPIFQTFYVTTQNEYDSKYGTQLLKIEQFAHTG